MLRDTIGLSMPVPSCLRATINPKAHSTTSIMLVDQIRIRWMGQRRAPSVDSFIRQWLLRLTVNRQLIVLLARIYQVLVVS